MKISVILLSLLILSGCAKKSEHSENIGPEKAYQIERLFSYDGCTVYRFHDVGRTIHYTNCKGSTTETHECGKNCTETSEVSTENTNEN